MEAVSSDLLVARFRMALEMHEEGVRMMRQNLRRQNPGATDETIESLLGAWLGDRPGAEFGDAEGVVRRSLLCRGQ